MANQTPTTDTNVPLSGMGVMPDDWGIPHSKDWFKHKAMWITSNYNHWIPRFTGTRWDTSRNPTTDRWATNIGKWISYYKATQDNITLGHFARDVRNRPLDIPIINGQTIYQICKHHEGKLYETYVKNLDQSIGVADRTKDYLDERLKKLELAKLQVDIEFARGADEIATVLQPIEGQSFRSYEDVEKYAEESPMEQIERIFTGAVKDFLWRNDWREIFQEIIRYLVVTYYCRVWVYAEKGRIKIRVYRPDMCIWDNWSDQYGKRDRYQGVIEALTIPELFTRYKFSEEEKKDLINISKHNTTGTSLPMWMGSTNTFIGNSNRMWWNLNTRIPTVMVAKTYWRGLKEDGVTGTLYGTDIIGNKYVRNDGEVSNIIEDKNNPSDVENQFIDCRPEMFYGSNQGIPERLSNLSDEVDALEQKNRLFIARAMGKVLFVNGSQMPENTTVREVLVDAKTAGVVVYEGASIEDAQERYPGQEIIDVAELTVDGQGIVANRAEINEKKRQMELIASTPEAVMGQQVLQGSNQELQSTITNASYGVVPLYESFYLFINIVNQRAADLAKIVYTQAESEMTLQLGVGLSKRDFMFVKFLKEWNLKDLHVYADQRDLVTDSEKMKYFDIVFNYSQNPDSGLTPDDAFMVLSLNSKREIINYLQGQRRIYEWKRMKEKEAEAAQAAQQTQATNQTMLDATAMNNETQIQKENMKTQRDLALKAMEPPAQ